MNTHTRWFESLTEGASGRAAAEKSGVISATLNRQLSKGELAMEVVVALARAYHRSPVTALVETGYLSADEAHHLDVVDSARLLSDQQLVRELARRVDDNEAAWQGTFDEVVDEATGQLGQGQPITIGTDDNVVTMNAKGEAARRSGIAGVDEEEQRWAARQSDMPSPGRALHKHLDGLGEEPQIGPDDD